MKSALDIGFGAFGHVSGGGAPVTTTLTVGLADSADPVEGGTNYDYTAVVTNTGAETATSVSATITLDASLAFVSGSGTGWIVTRVGRVVTGTRATLAVGAAPTITITVTAGSSAVTASTTADAIAANAPAATQDVETTVVQATTLTVAIDDSADPVIVSTNYNYTTVVTNTGARTANSVSAVIHLDASLAFVSGSGTGWSVSNASGVVTCTRATLAVGAAPTITITATAGASAISASTTADASASNAPAATQDTEATAIIATTTLAVAINDSADPVTVLTNFDYSIIVTNTGSASASSVSAVIVLDSTLTFVSGSGTGWSVSNSSGTVTCTRASLAVGAAPTITITATAGAVPRTDSTTADASAFNAAAATQDVETTNISAAGTTLTVAISDSVDPAITAVNFNYSVVVTNTGSIAAATVSSVMVLDASLTFVSGSGTGWSVSNSSGTVTCTRATLAVGAAPMITITATTGGSALTASTTADASAANAPAATQDVETTVVKLVAKDATSGIRSPASLTQWQDFNAYHVAIGTTNYPNVTPSALYLCQEASGNLADSIGSATLTLAGTGHLFQQAVSGWSRLAIQCVNGTAGQKWITTTTAPNPSTTSTNWLSIISFPAASPAAARCLMASQAGLDMRFSTGGKVTIINSASTNGTSDPRGAVHVVEMKHDITNSAFVGYTDQEKIVGTYGATASNTTFAIGGQQTTASGSAYLYVAIFSGAAAELTDAQHKARQTAMGFAPPW